MMGCLRARLGLTGIAGLLMVAALGPVHAQNTPLPVDPFADLTNLFRLTHPLTGGTGQASSYDRTGGNADAIFWYYLRAEPKRVVMADLRGPGSVSRIWVTAFDSNTARIEIFVDGAATPVVSAFMRDFFGNLSPFTPPLSTPSTGSWVSYVPIPFQRSCRIEAINARSDNNVIYYNVSYRSFPPGEPMPANFQMPPGAPQQAAINQFNGQWASRGQDPKAALPGQQTLTGSPFIGAGQTATLASIPGAGILTGIRLSINPNAGDALFNARIRCRWDGSGASAVDSPLGAFFGCGFGPANAAALPLGTSNGQMYCYFPMPYSNGAIVELVNTSSTPMNPASFTLTHVPQSAAAIGRLRFHAEARSQTPASGGQPSYQILSATGRGHFLGCVMSIESLDGNWGVLEGDESIYVNGEGVPSIQGTGAEDYFNGGFYFLGGPVSLPFSGCSVITGSFPLRMSAYRLCVTDPVPFKSGILATIQHGGVNEANGNYFSTAFYYRDDAAGPPPSDPVNGPLTALPLVNGGFENGFGGYLNGEANGWLAYQSREYYGQTLCTFSAANDQVFSGGWSQKVVIAPPVGVPSNAGVAQQVQVARGSTYQITARLRLNLTGSLQPGDVLARLGIGLAGDTYFDQPSVQWTTTPPTANTWHTLTAVVTAQSDHLAILAGGLRQLNGVPGTATVWIDDVSIQPFDGPPPPPPLPIVDNPSFETGLSPWQLWIGSGGNSDPLERDLLGGAAPDGFYVLAVKGFGGGGKGACEYIANNWVPGRQYRLAVRVRNLANSGMNYSIGHTLGNTGVAGAANASYGNPVAGTSSWQVITKDFTYSGAEGVTIYLRATNAGASERAGFDLVTIEDITPTGAPPAIFRSPSSFTHSINVGAGLPDDGFIVQNSGGQTLNYTITTNTGWLSVQPAAGASSGEQDPISVLYNTAGLPVGTHNGTITITDPAATNNPQTISVTLHVQTAPAPIIFRSPTSFTRTMTQGGSLSNDTFNVQNTGGAGSTLNYTLTDNASWLSTSPASGTSTGEQDAISVIYTVSNLAAGNYSATLTITGAGATNSPQTISVNLTVEPPPIPGDFDGDGDVDLVNFGHLQACASGSGFPPTLNCGDADLDGDNDVDSIDFAVFLACLSGPGIPGNPNCAE